MKTLIEEERARQRERGQNSLDAYRKAALALRERGLISTEEYRDWMMEHGDATLAERERQFDTRLSFEEKKFREKQKADERDYKLGLRRVAAYEQAVRRGGDSAAIKEAEQAAEAEFWISEAEESEREAQRLEEKNEYGEYDDDIGRLRRDARQSRRRAGVLNVRAGGAKAPSQMTEEEIRAEARRRGVDETAAVEKWRRLSVGAAYQGRRYPLSALPGIASKLGMSEEEARRFVEARGGTFQ